MHQAGSQVYADVVFNHKDGADETERFQAQEVDWETRNTPQLQAIGMRSPVGPSSRFRPRGKVFADVVALVVLRRS